MRTDENNLVLVNTVFETTERDVRCVCCNRRSKTPCSPKPNMTVTRWSRDRHVTATRPLRGRYAAVTRPLRGRYILPY
jgi:hypothetical protein